jgi:hypothetical protein
MPSCVSVFSTAGRASWLTRFEPCVSHLHDDVRRPFLGHRPPGKSWVQGGAAQRPKAPEIGIEGRVRHLIVKPLASAPADLEIAGSPNVGIAPSAWSHVGRDCNAERPPQRYPGTRRQRGRSIQARKAGTVSARWSGYPQEPGRRVGSIRTQSPKDLRRREGGDQAANTTSIRGVE